MTYNQMVKNISFALQLFAEHLEPQTNTSTDDEALKEYKELLYKCGYASQED